MNKAKTLNIDDALAAEIGQLAIDLDKFSEDEDTYEYWDYVDDPEESIRSTKSQILNGKLDSIKEYIQLFIEADSLSDPSVAEALIRRLDEVKRNINEQNPTSSPYKQVGEQNDSEPKDA